MQIKVFNEDVDSYGIAHHARLILYLERARIEFLEAAGIGFKDLAAQHGGFFVLRKLHVRYLAPAMLGDLLIATTLVGHIKHASVTMEQTLQKATHKVLTAAVEMVWLEQKQRKPMAMPAALKRSLGT